MLNGIDIASYQSSIVPSRLTTTDFVIVKFTQGNTYRNPYAETQYNGARASGKLLGAYHYATGKDAKKEAQFFVWALGDHVGECVLALDWEGYQNGKFGSGQDVAWCLAWLNEVYRLTGSRPLIYMSKSVCRKYDWSPVAQHYALWCAQYASNSATNYQSEPWTDSHGWGAWKHDTIRQYSSHGRISGYGGNIDINRCYLSADEWRAMAKGGSVAIRSRDKVAELAQSFVGVKEGSAKHHELVDTYNNYCAKHGYPRGYKVKYSDSWCAVFVSDLAILTGYTDIIPVECGCPQMIELAKQMGIWVEDDNYTPLQGDFILYDWQDSGSGDNKGTADHIGCVVKVSGKGMLVVEGNRNDKVSEASMAVGGRYIRGYIVPKYNKTDEPKKEETKKDKVDEAHTVEFYAIVNTRTDPLNIRTGAGTNYKTCSFSPLPKGTKVGVCKHRVGKWWLIKYNGKYGYAYSDYLKRI